MNIRLVILLVLALGTAGSSAFMAQNWLKSERAEILASVPTVTAFKEEKIEILVAEDDLIPGSFLLKSKLSWQEWPEDALNEQMLRKGDVEKEDFEGYVIRDRISAGQPLVPNALVQSGEQGFLAAVLAPGMRAISVPINATSGVAGFVFPGDRVDLLLTIGLKPDEEKTVLKRKFHFTQTLLKDVRILAKDQNAVQTEGDAQVAKNVTIEVTPKQAEAVSLGMQIGKMSLALRSLAEEEKILPEVFSNVPDPLFKYEVGLKKNAEFPLQPSSDFLEQNEKNAPFRPLEIQDNMSMTTDVEVNFFRRQLHLWGLEDQRNGGSSGSKVQIQRGSNSTVKEFN